MDPRGGRGYRRAVKIALIGNCQVTGLAACLRALNPSLEAESFIVGSAGAYRSLDDAADLARRLAGYDTVLAHKLDPVRYAPLSMGALRTSLRRVVPMPPIAFSGFHPDVVILPAVKSAGLGAYHSIIVAGAWLARVPAHRVEALFNAYIFARLGYMNEYGLARAFMAARLAKARIEPEPVLQRWEASGRFMHTPNHPAVGALHGLAQGLCERLGVRPEPAGELPEDELAQNVRLPVYPEIARRLGVAGAREAHLRSGEALTIRQCVELAYAAYEADGPDLAAIPQIAAAAALLRQELDRAA